MGQCSVVHRGAGQCIVVHRGADRCIVVHRGAGQGIVEDHVVHRGAGQDNVEGHVARLCMVKGHGVGQSIGMHPCFHPRRKSENNEE